LELLKLLMQGLVRERVLSVETWKMPRVEPTIRGNGDMPVEMQNDAGRVQRSLREAMQRGMRSSFPPHGCWRTDQPKALQRQLQDGDSPDSGAEIRRRKRRLKTKKTRNSDRRTEDSKRAIRKWTKHADTELDQRFGNFSHSVLGVCVLLNRR